MLRQALLISAVLCACGSGAAPPSTAAAPSATASLGVSHTCQATELRASPTAPRTHGNATGVVIVLSNQEAGTCGLQGYPDVHLLSHDSQAPITVTHGGGAVFGTPPAAALVLHPGQSAYLGVEWEATAPCMSVDSVEIMAGGEKQPLLAPVSLSVCGGGVAITPLLGAAP